MMEIVILQIQFPKDPCFYGPEDFCLGSQPPFETGWASNVYLPLHLRLLLIPFNVLELKWFSAHGPI